MTTPRILLTGSRYWGRNLGERDIAVRFLVWLRDNTPAGTVLMHGGCPAGLDALADGLWWGAFGRTTEEWPARWDDCGPECPVDPAHRRARTTNDTMHPGDEPTYCPGAGPRRNTAMVESGPDCCYAFYGPFSRGARGCADTAATHGIPTYRWRPGGPPPWEWRPHASGTPLSTGPDLGRPSPGTVPGDAPELTPHGLRHPTVTPETAPGRFDN